MDAATGFAATSDLGLAAYGADVRTGSRHGFARWQGTLDRGGFEAISSPPWRFHRTAKPWRPPPASASRTSAYGMSPPARKSGGWKATNPGSALWCSGRTARNSPPAVPIKRFASGMSRVESVWTCCAVIVWKCGGWRCCPITRPWSAGAKMAWFACGIPPSRIHDQERITWPGKLSIGALRPTAARS